jgi:hypothetical protein
MEAVCSSETLVDTHRTTRRYIPQVYTLNRLLLFIRPISVHIYLVFSNHLEANILIKSVNYHLGQKDMSI